MNFDPEKTVIFSGDYDYQITAQRGVHEVMRVMRGNVLAGFKLLMKSQR